ncbi:MAG: 3,4-dihydroxy-2-butanone-4-phosphate synthase [Deltaproteobacteria bacterium]|nr:3,4-dihydroxy-2-butanone-4-phosphate synthase [Deltaproteobacteria bacterium]
MVILVDDEDRENEGDLTMAAEMVNPEAITFMATKGCGLICVTLTPKRVDMLGLQMMVDENQAPLGTAFTVSIEAAEGVTTGISAADRSHTIQVAADPSFDRSALVSPGHVFPLKAMPGGVLQRTGQTEGSVDLARLAGLTPAGVICEIMKQDGTMARMPDLEQFAAEHDLTIVSIADLIEYRLQRDRLVERVETFSLELGAEHKAIFQAHVYSAVPGIRRREYVALCLGDIDDGEPVPCRGHVASLADDVFGAHTRANSPRIGDVIDALIRRGRGVVLYLPSRDTICDELTSSQSSTKPVRGRRDREGEIREYGIGAQILLDLGVRRLQVISNNPHRLVGLEAWGFESTKQISIEEI